MKTEKQNRCNRCGKIIPATKWWLCDGCDRLQPLYLSNNHKKPAAVATKYKTL